MVRRRPACRERKKQGREVPGTGREDCNDFSIGIELEGLEGEPFDDPQYASLATLLASLANRYPIRDVAGHEHVAPGRKHDPGNGFEWPLLRRRVTAAGLAFAA